MATTKTGSEISVDETALDVLLDALKTLKLVGCRMEDETGLWNSNEIFHAEQFEGDSNSVASNENLAAIAKASLSKLKSASKALHAISNSLDETVKSVTDHFAPLFRSIGLKSLPDDVIARIFELHHEDAKDPVRRPAPFHPCAITIRSSNVLTSICRRFRQIALRIPGLCDVVSDGHRTPWVLELKERTQRPSVCISYLSRVSEERTLSAFLRLLHPSSQWKALNVRYENENESEGRSCFECIALEHNGDLGQLRSLTLSRGWRDVYGEDNTVPAGHPYTMLSSDDHLLLSKWKLDKLERLSLQDCIPYKLKCPNVTECEVSLSMTNTLVGWDVLALKKFLNGLENLESLSLSLSNAESSLAGHDVVSLKLPSLTSFTLDVWYCTESTFVKDFMTQWDSPNLIELTIALRYCSEDMGRSNPNVWLSAIFNSSSTRSRAFPKVQIFRLSVKDMSRMLDYRSILEAMPRVRDLTWELPQGAELVLNGFVRENDSDDDDEEGCLKNLRRLRLKNCSMMYGPHMLNSIERLREKLGDFELAVEGCSNFAGQKDRLRELFGDKFVWKA